jgi:hypothetical protein
MKLSTNMILLLAGIGLLLFVFMGKKDKSTGANSGTPASSTPQTGGNPLTDILNWGLGKIWPQSSPLAGGTTTGGTNLNLTLGSQAAQKANTAAAIAQAATGAFKSLVDVYASLTKSSLAPVTSSTVASWPSATSPSGSTYFLGIPTAGGGMQTYAAPIVDQINMPDFSGYV